MPTPSIFIISLPTLIKSPPKNDVIPENVIRLSKAVTGAANLDSADAKQKVQELKGLTELPVVIGFGIKDAQSAISVKEAADGVVVGSVFVDLVGEGGDILEKVTKKTRELSEALS